MSQFQYTEDHQPHWLGTVSISGTVTLFLHLARLHTPSPEAIGTVMLQVDNSDLQPLEAPLTPADVEKLNTAANRIAASGICSQLPERSRAIIDEIARALFARDLPTSASPLRRQGVPPKVIDGYEHSLNIYLSFPFVQPLDWSQVTSDTPLENLPSGQHAYIDVPAIGVNGDVIHLAFDCWRSNGDLVRWPNR